jgi:hypothetical protein
MVERYPNLKEEVGGSIPGCRISSLPLALVDLLSQKEEEKKT